MLDKAMTFLIKVQLGNENKQVEDSLDTITDDIDNLIDEEYGDI